jgi:hypothetical protein
MRRLALTHPASSLSGAVDVLAGYCLAAPARPEAGTAVLVLPALFVSVVLLRSAGHVFDACFALCGGDVSRPDCSWRSAVLADEIDKGTRSLKGVFLFGAALALAGVFAGLLGALRAGRLPAYVAALIFLTTWASSGCAAHLAVCGPVAAGLLRALGLAMGMSAHRESLYLASNAPILALAAYFIYGAMTKVLALAQREGGTRFALVGATVGLLAAFAATALLVVRTPLSFIVIVVGAVFVCARAWQAVVALTPASVRRYAAGALIASGFLAAAICYGNPLWSGHGVAAAAGTASLVLVIATGLLVNRFSLAPRTGTQEGHS